MSSKTKGQGIWSSLRLPFKKIRSTYYRLRKNLFVAPRPAGVYFVVDADLDTVEAALGEAFFAPNWQFSYYKRGEVLNLARVSYERTQVDGRTYDWWQTHVRGWEGADGIELRGHWELEPTENDNDHIDGVGFSTQRGMETLDSVLQSTDLDYHETEVATPTAVESDIPVES